jgi:outer membrane autotransporter protein
LLSSVGVAALLLGSGLAVAADVEITTNQSTRVDLDALAPAGSTAHVAPGVTIAVSTGGTNEGVIGVARAWLLTNEGSISTAFPTVGTVIRLPFAGSGVVNQGTISSGTAAVNGITMIGGGSVSNAAGASINTVASGIVMGLSGAGGGPGTVDNFGTISNTGTGDTVILIDDGTVNNRGTIQTSGATNAVSAAGAGTRNVINSGIIVNTTPQAQANFSAGVLFGGTAGTATLLNTASGQISADYNGVFASGAYAVDITNNGRITSTRGPAVELTNTLGQTLVNTGIIQSAQNGISAVRNASITNSGTIGSTGAGNAIVFGNGPGAPGGYVHTLTLQTGSILNGNVVGATANSTDNLILQGTNTETLSKFLNFETLSMQGTDWTLNNNGTFATSATAQSGVLRVNGQLTTPLTTIATTGTLAGTGRIVGNVINNGTIAPGNSIGTLNVTGTYTQASGSTYTVEVDTSPASDLINVTGAAVIQANATVHVLAAPGLYTLGHRYTILTASLGVTGQYATLTDNAPFVDFILGNDANNIYLDVLRSSVSFHQVAQTPNQRAAATGAETLGGGNAVFNALVMLNQTDALRAFDALSGEGHATARGILVEESRFIRDAVTSRLRQWSGGVTALLAPVLSAFRLDAPSEAEEALAYAAKAPAGALPRGSSLPIVQPRYFTTWGQVLGNWGDTSGNGNAASSSRSTGGLIAGTDITLDETWRVGVATGYQSTSFTIDDRATSGDADTYHLAAYGGMQRGPLAVRAGAAYAWHSLATERAVAFPGFAERLKANYRGATGQAFGEIGYSFTQARIAFEPFAALAHVNTSTASFAEAGGTAALTAAGARNGVTYSTLGLRAATPLALHQSVATTLRGSLGWRHAFGDRAVLSTFAFNAGAGTPFTVAAVPIAGDALAVEAGLDAQITPLMSLGVSYVGQLAAHARDHALKGNLTARF